MLLSAVKDLFERSEAIERFEPFELRQAELLNPIAPSVKLVVKQSQAGEVVRDEIRRFYYLDNDGPDDRLLRL